MAIILSAIKAKELAEQGSADDVLMAQEKLEAAIIKAAKAGHFECWLSPEYRLLKIMERIAINHGYSAVITESQRDGNSIKISWR